MKKIKLISGLLLSAMAFASCSEDFTDWASPQSNPQESAISLPGYQAEPVSAIDLSAVEGDSVQIMTLTQAALPEGSVIDYTRIELLPVEGEETTPVTLNVDNEGRVGKADLQATLEGFYGKSPVQRILSGNVYSDIVINGQAFFVDAHSINVVATPDAPYIASAYYLVGDMCGWDAASAIKFTHSGANVYDDPVFSVVFTTPKADCYWKIVPQGNIDSGDFWHEGTDGVVGVAVDGDASLTGSLVTTAPQAGKIEKQGFYKLTINMIDYTYTIEEMAATYYLVGDFGGAASWDISNFNYALYPQTTTTQSYTTKWTGSGSFKFFTEANNWDSAYGAELGTTAGAASGKLASNANNGADNISVPEVGAYYTFTVDMSAMTYTWTKCDESTVVDYNKIGLIGVNGDWNDNSDVFLTQVTSHNWYVEVDVTSDCEVKFRVDGNWNVMDWGADVNIADQSYGTGTKGGTNIKLPAGKYKVYFNDITGQFLFLAE